MKKTYSIPTTQVVKVELQHIIAESSPLSSIGETGGTVSLTEESADENSDSWSRSIGSWNDED